MKSFRFILLNFILSLLFYPSYAQYFNQGQERASLRWKQIRTVNFQVIFPEGFEKQGEHVAKLLEKAYEYVPVSLNHQPKKISVVLHTETVKSNAFLGWCPGRIEMYTTPHQGIYAQDWLEQLSIHEFRHVVQVSKLEEEMPQILRFLVGEHAAALLTAAHLPFWFIEGDAVAAETGLSESGRGRMPDFHRELKTQLVEKGKYSFDKAYLGSFRDQVANHYQMGYLMVGGAREKYNKLIWDTVLTYIATHPFCPLAFVKGLKKSIGSSSKQLYTTVFDDLSNRWKREDSHLNPTINSPVSGENRYYTNYTNCFRLLDGNYFAERSGLADINRFVSITPEGVEKQIFTPGYHFEESVNARENLIVWSERLSHIRWSHADKSLLRIYDVNSEKLREYTYDSKIFAPAVSPDLKKIIAVEADNQYTFYLSEIEIATGNIHRYNSNGTDYFITPGWSEEPEKILCVILRNNRKGIAKVNLENGSEEVILNFKNQEIKKPIEHKGYVYFIGGYRGTDDLYAIEIASKKVFRVITSRFGISDFSFDDRSIIYSDYTSDGFRFVKTNFDSIAFQEMNTDTIKNQSPFASTLSTQEQQPINFSTLDNISYQAESYQKPAHLFKFHSWAPLSIDPYGYQVYPGVSFMSQNMLSTTESVLGYRYKWEEKKGEYYFNFKYMGWFPVFDFQTDLGNSKSSYFQVNQYLNANKEVVRTDTIRKDFSWNETNIVARVFLPLNFSKGKYYRTLYPIINYRYTYYNKDNNAPNNFPQGKASSVEGALRFYSVLQQSAQDIYPEWGLLVDVGYMHSLAGVLNFGQFSYYSSSFYLPGIFENHGVRIYNGYQAKNQEDFSLTDRIRFPRGHQKIKNQSMFSFGIDYKLPLIYPDKNIGRFIYIKKIDVGLFYDQAFLKHSVDDGFETKIVKSTGIEILFNTNFLRFLAPVEIGFRSSYLFNEEFKTDFLFNINFTL